MMYLSERRAQERIAAGMNPKVAAIMEAVYANTKVCPGGLVDAYLTGKIRRIIESEDT